ncbi:hypothetical protein TNCV_2035451, partial [Trichonephila clavipes]
PSTPLTPEPISACGRRRAAMTRLKNQETMIDGYQKFLATFSKGKDEHGVYKQLQESLNETIEARDSLDPDLPTDNTVEIPKIPPPLPVYLKINNNYRNQLDQLKEKFPEITTKTSGKYLKLNLESHEEQRDLVNFMDQDKISNSTFFP